MKSVIVSEDISNECERELCRLGFEVLKLPRAKALGGSAVGSHPDSLIFHHESTLITSCDYCDEAAYIFSDARERHPEITVRFSEHGLGERFPEDCGYNAKAFSGRLFGRLDSLSPAILRYAEETGLEPIRTKQGYPACVTLFLGENRVITGDEGLAKIYDKCKLRVTKITNRGISLPPHEYGFIGGASGVFKNTVYFFGDISAHPDADVILEAIADAGYAAHSLSREPLRDLGGMIFLGE